MGEVGSSSPSDRCQIACRRGHAGRNCVTICVIALHFWRERVWRDDLRSTRGDALQNAKRGASR